MSHLVYQVPTGLSVLAGAGRSGEQGQQGALWCGAEGLLRWCGQFSCNLNMSRSTVPCMACNGGSCCAQSLCCCVQMPLLCQTNHQCSCCRTSSSCQHATASQLQGKVLCTQAPSHGCCRAGPSGSSAPHPQAATVPCRVRASSNAARSVRRRLWQPVHCLHGRRRTAAGSLAASGAQSDHHTMAALFFWIAVTGVHAPCSDG
jgi:hypothetical protein